VKVHSRRENNAAAVLLLMELDFFQIKLREIGDKVMEQNSTGSRTRKDYSPVEKVEIQRENTWRIRYR